MLSSTHSMLGWLPLLWKTQSPKEGWYLLTHLQQSLQTLCNVCLSGNRFGKRTTQSRGVCRVRAPASTAQCGCLTLPYTVGKQEMFHQSRKSGILFSWAAALTNWYLMTEICRYSKSSFKFCINSYLSSPDHYGCS